MWRISFLNCLYLVLVTPLITHSQSRDPFEQVNSIYDEQNPVLNPKGNVLFFTRSHHPGNVGGRRDRGDIWYSILQNDKTWSEPKNARVLNDFSWNGILGVLPNGDILLAGHYSHSRAPVRTQGVSIAKRRGGTSWGRPVNINIPYFRNLSDRNGGYLSQDGTVLLLSLEGYGTKGVEDIYICSKLASGEWSEPKNLGSVINTRYQELTPFLSTDKRVLYFSSNGHGGNGSSDIFMSERLDDTWVNWSEPQLVKNINTGGRELGFRVYNGFSLYSSTQNSDGYGDIKMYTDFDVDSLLDEVIALNDSITFQEIKEKDPDHITLHGGVYDAASGGPLNASIFIASGDSSFMKLMESVPSGNYSATLPAEGSYRVRVDAPGYISHQEQVEVIKNEGQSWEMNFSLQVISVGTTVNLENVLFKQSKPDIVESSYQELDFIAEFLKENPSIKIRLEGHTDNRGDAKQNLKLSKERVNAVRDYLVKKGISKKRINGKGYGGTRPVADNDDPETRKLNRRVEFTIIKK